MENPETILELDLTLRDDRSRFAGDGPTAVARRLRALMRERGVDRRTFVEAFGWRNRSRGFRRLDAWLAGEPPNEGQLLGIVRLLDVERRVVLDCPDGRRFHYRDGEFEREGGLIVPWYPGFAGGRRYPAFGLR